MSSHDRVHIRYHRKHTRTNPGPDHVHVYPMDALFPYYQSITNWIVIMLSVTIMFLVYSVFKCHSLRHVLVSSVIYHVPYICLSCAIPRLIMSRIISSQVVYHTSCTSKVSWSCQPFCISNVYSWQLSHAMLTWDFAYKIHVTHMLYTKRCTFCVKYFINQFLKSLLSYMSISFFIFCN